MLIKSKKHARNKDDEHTSFRRGVFMRMPLHTYKPTLSCLNVWDGSRSDRKPAVANAADVADRVGVVPFAKYAFFM